jgi:alpha-tubulin suppressor-like RCC1 family protein
MSRWCALLLCSFMVACSQEIRPATQLLVVVDSDLELGTVLSSLRVSVQSRSGDDVLDEPFPLTLAARESVGRFTLPLSFGVVRNDVDSVRVVVAGYGPLGPGGQDVKLVEQKAILSFQAERTLRASVFLGQACVNEFCAGGGDLVCYPRALAEVAAGACGPVPLAVVERVEPGSELVGVVGSTRRDAAMPTPDAAAAADAAVESASPDAAPSEAADPDAEVNAAAVAGDADAGPRDSCANNPCGADALCIAQGEAFSCVCPEGQVGPSPQQCRRVERRLSARHASCVIRKDGSVWCWNLGTRTLDIRPHVIEGLTDAIEVAVGSAHACARKADGAVVCWGDNSYGQLGNGTTTPSATPVIATGLQNASALTAGNTFSCALDASARVQCWGDGSACVTGGCRGNTNVPTLTAGLDDVVKLAAGHRHVCAIKRDGTVWCWGHASGGALGNGEDSPSGRATPTQVLGLASGSEISAGDAITCALTGANALSCWGTSFWPGAEVINDDLRSAEPVPVVTPGKLAKLTVGNMHQCALQGRTAFCRGYNGFGQLGDGTKNSSLPASAPASTFTAVKLSDVLELSAGTSYTCALRGDDTVFCWGNNLDGQLGTGYVDDGSPLPIEPLFP